MTRRKKAVAAALSLPLALALGVGFTVRRAGSDPLSADVCDKDLAAVFEYCKAGGEVCDKAREGEHDACQAGCVMMTCPNHVACTELDPIWCKPCDDVDGALHWRVQLEAYKRCEPSPGWQPSNDTEVSAYEMCAQKETLRVCPSLADKPQWRWTPAFRERRRELCDSEFEDVVQTCDKDCALETGAYKAGCKAGCLMRICPDQFACTGNDPIRCAPCEDTRGALHWSQFSRAEGRCTSLHPSNTPSSEMDKRADCVVAEMEQSCPALAGTEWWRQSRTLVHHYGSARPSPAPPASP